MRDPLNTECPHSRPGESLADEVKKHDAEGKVVQVMERNRKADTLNFLRDCGLEANKNILQSQDLGLAV